MLTCSTLQRASTNETAHSRSIGDHATAACSTLQRASTNETLAPHHSRHRSVNTLAVPFNGRLPMKPHKTAWLSDSLHLAVPFNGRLPMKPSYAYRWQYSIVLAVPFNGRLPMKRPIAVAVLSRRPCSTLQRASTNETTSTELLKSRLDLAVPFNGRLPMKRELRCQTANSRSILAVPFNGRLPMKHAFDVALAPSRALQYPSTGVYQ